VITRAVLDERVREWGLRDDVVEKDYVLGEASGIDFSVQEPRVRLRPAGARPREGSTTAAREERPRRRGSSSI